MPDKDLRKQALGASKTVSRKSMLKSGERTPNGSRTGLTDSITASSKNGSKLGENSSKSGSKSNSKASSMPSSAKASRNVSRITSRDVSHDEDYDSGSDDSENTNLYELAESEDFKETDVDLLAERLRSIIEQIVDRKGSSTEGREVYYRRYNRMLMSHHFDHVIRLYVEPLLVAFGRSVKAETTPQETIEALRAVSLTAVSFSNSELFEAMGQTIKRLIVDTQDDPTKVAAIHCLAACASFGGATESTIAEVCTFLLEVVESDGSYIGAEDNGDVVTAAIQEWAYLTTEIQDFEDESNDAIEVLLDQLDSNDSNVQIAAGEAIALLFERSVRLVDPDSEESEDEDVQVGEVGPEESSIVHFKYEYSPYHYPHKVVEKAEELARVHSHHMNKRDKIKLRKTFKRVAATVEKPYAGLINSSSLNAIFVVKLHQAGDIHVDKWWKFVRLNFLRRLLGAGFIHHYYEGNSQILHSVPVIVRPVDDTARHTRKHEKKERRSKIRNGGLYNDED